MKKSKFINTEKNNEVLPFVCYYFVFLHLFRSSEYISYWLSHILQASSEKLMIWVTVNNQIIHTLLARQ